MEVNKQYTTTTTTRGAVDDHDDDEVLKSPFTRVYVRPETEQIINCAMGLKHPINISEIKQALSNSILLQHPRFTSLLVKPNGPNSRERWRRIQIKLDDHIIIHQSPPVNGEQTSVMNVKEEEDYESASVTSYLAELAVSSPLSRDKPLWELHIFVGGGLNFVVLRVHHGIGDGVSLMSMLSACFSSGGSGKESIGVGMKRRKRGGSGGIWGMVKSLGWTVGFVIKAAGRSLWVKDDYEKMIGLTTGGGSKGVEKKVVVTAKFKLDDMRSVKRHVPNATTNDVLLGVISSGLSRYLKLHSPKGLADGHQITGVIMVNMRKSPGLLKPENVISGDGWGNKVGVFIIPINYSNSLHPLQHVRKAKSLMDKKKRSFEAQIVDKYNSLTTYFCGPKILTTSYRRVARNTTFMLSNIMGPQQEISIAGNPVTYIKLTTSTLPNMITMHMVSYMGKAHLQIMVPKDIVHDPPFLAKCFEDSLLEMITTPLNSTT